MIILLMSMGICDDVVVRIKLVMVVCLKFFIFVKVLIGCLVLG